MRLGSKRPRAPPSREEEPRRASCVDEPDEVRPCDDRRRDVAAMVGADHVDQDKVLVVPDRVHARAS